MFKIDGKRFTYDIGNKQSTPDSSYPVDDNGQFEIGNANRIITDENFIKIGDDISPLTKETLSNFLKNTTLGEAGSNKHSNDFPINATPDREISHTNQFGFPADLQDPQIGQNKFISRNDVKLNSYFNKTGLNALEIEGFRKGLDESGTINGQDLLINNNSTVTQLYVDNNNSGILKNNRYLPDEKYINDLDSLQDPDVEVSITQSEKDEFGAQIRTYSPLTKETLSNFLKNTTLGQAGSNKHSNDFPIGGTPDLNISHTNQFGFPADLKDPQNGQKKFISRNESTLNSYFNQKGLIALENEGFRKGLDEAAEFNGQDLLNKNSNIATEKYVENNISGILRNNRFSPDKKFINDLNSFQDPSIDIPINIKNEKDDFGSQRKDYKSLRTDQLSVIGTNLLDKGTLSFKDLGILDSITGNNDFSFAGDGKINNIDIKKIFEDSIKNSNEFKEKDFNSIETPEINKLFPSYYSPDSPYGTTNFDVNLSNIAIKASLTIILASGAFLISTLEPIINSVLNKSESLLNKMHLNIINKNSFLNIIEKEIIIHNQLLDKTITTDFILNFKGERINKEKAEGENGFIQQIFAKINNISNLFFLGFKKIFIDLDFVIQGKNIKSILFDIIRDNGIRAKKISNLFSEQKKLLKNISIDPSIEIINIFLNSKLRKFSEFIILMGLFELKYNSTKANLDLNSTSNDFTAPGSVSSGNSYKYNNYLPAVNLINTAVGLNPDYLHASSINYNPYHRDTSKKTFGSTTSDSESYKIFKQKEIIYKAIFEKNGDKYVPFYMHDLRTKEFISFNAFIESLSDEFTPNFESIESFGRLEAIKIYKDTQRKINVSFKMFSTNKNDFDYMWFKINKLLTLIYPQYTIGRKTEFNDTITEVIGRDHSVDIVNETQRKTKSYIPYSQIPFGTPMIRLRIGDLIKSNYSRNSIDRLFVNNEIEKETISPEQIANSPIVKQLENSSDGLAGVIDSLSFDWDGSPWELDEGRQAPKELKVSFGFTPIHDISPGIDHFGFNRAPIYNIGNVNKAIFANNKNSNIYTNYYGVAQKMIELAEKQAEAALAKLIKELYSNIQKYKLDDYFLTNSSIGDTIRQDLLGIIRNINKLSADGDDVKKDIEKLTSLLDLLSFYKFVATELKNKIDFSSVIADIQKNNIRNQYGSDIIEDVLILGILYDHKQLEKLPILLSLYAKISEQFHKFNNEYKEQFGFLYFKGSYFNIDVANDRKDILSTFFKYLIKFKKDDFFLRAQLRSSESNEDELLNNGLATIKDANDKISINGADLLARIYIFDLNRFKINAKTPRPQKRIAADPTTTNTMEVNYSEAPSDFTEDFTEGGVQEISFLSHVKNWLGF